ncbi:hypothetical protein [Pseudonocardia spinosispora]|uniref:hypothetical protein n=1 Tax=Pseudonocardia spinosispora TaxID=103441 RepID=UPI0004280DBF|nr:hypothetical protein [Pseudonocardia spinosispora]
MAQLPSPGTNRPQRPRTSAPEDIGFVPRPPVTWLAPGVLARTGVQVAISTLFGSYADRRELQRAESGEPLDLSGRADDSRAGDSRAGDFWLDYVADIGDGVDGAMTVASQLARDELQLDGQRTRAGSLLVMGGDEAYPVASMANYNDRIVGPYRAMLPWADEPRWLVALPGNHDWYDGLTSFLRQFCQGRWIGGWKTAQTRSYFAVKLPGGWWLWGIDVALGDDIDEPQLDYFREMAGRMEPDDAIILCWAMPSWVESGPDNPEGYAPLEYFERTVIPDRAMLRLSLSGDLHHYARYQGQDEAAQQKITAGGGGAYLFGTHQLPETLNLPPVESRDPNKRAPVRYDLAERYPSAATSKSLRAGIFGAVFRSPKFWAVPALIYLLLGVTLARALPGLARSRWWSVSVPDLVLALVLIAAVYLGLAAFTTLSRKYRRLRHRLGFAHTVAHLVVVLATVYLGELLGHRLGWPSSGRAAAVAVLCALVGAAIGPLVVALYLLLADMVKPRGVNTEELFSAQAIQDYKCFLRLRIAEDGTLTVFPVKIDKVVHWTFAAEGDTRGPWFRPADGVPPAPELIEPPITITKRPTAPPPSAAAGMERDQ